MKKYTAYIGLVICLSWVLIHSTPATAMSSPPPEPSPEPVIPLLDSIPGNPSLSAELERAAFKLSWKTTDHAEYYPVYIQNGGQWQRVENIYETTVTYDYQQLEWNPNTCDSKSLPVNLHPYGCFGRLTVVVPIQILSDCRITSQC